MKNRTLLAAALVTLAACGRGGGDAASTATQPAGTQPTPTAQHQAAPQTGPNTPQATDAQPPAPGAKPKTYAECMSMPVTVSEAERERACMTLPDAPKK
jgi:glucose/arabinose dehydrogenase